MQKAPAKLILGNAGKKTQDAITLDIDPLHNPDVVHDLNKAPWPFRDNQFHAIIAHHVLEHLNNFHAAMEELHRICSPGGYIYIEVPHHTSWCANSPHHILRFGYFSFDGYIRNNPTWISGNKFICLKREVTFHKFYRFFLLHKIFNNFPVFYERFLCFIFPSEHLKIWLRPQK